MDSESPASSLAAEAAFSPALLVGLVLLAAIIGGHTAHFFHIPRVVGFLLAGVILRALLLYAASLEHSGVTVRALDEAAGVAETIKQLALGVILFTIGGVFERTRLRAAGPRVLRISRYEIVFTLVLVSGGCWMVAMLTQPQAGGAQNLILALLLGIAAIATAPAATLLVLQEYEAKGPITETIL
ncbi:MAG: cation:proton antiporter, partial [Planctomycetes bacterium]|nr:cation:proton antiporter [Planctomycetota bacterium]